MSQKDVQGNPVRRAKYAQPELGDMHAEQERQHKMFEFKRPAITEIEAEARRTSGSKTATKSEH